MAYYKVKNVTNTLAKRDINKDKELSIKLNNGLFPVEEKIGVGAEVLIECMRLPTELQKLRIKGLVNITEVSKNDYITRLNETQKPKTPTTTSKVSTKDKKSTTTSKKKSTTSSTKKSSSSTKSTKSEKISDSVEE